MELLNSLVKVEFTKNDRRKGASSNTWEKVLTNEDKNDGKDDDSNDLIDIKNDVQDCHLRLRIFVTMKKN